MVAIRRSLFRVLLGLCLSATAASAGAAPEERVICPPVDREDRPGSNSVDPFGGARQPELIVLGKLKVGANTDRKRIDEFEIEKVLAGATSAKKLRVSGAYREGQRLILALVHDHYDADKSYDVLHRFDPDEEKAVCALAAARFDYNVLASECIFLGKEVDSAGGDCRVVEVVNSLAGANLKKGERVTVAVAGYADHVNQKAPLRGEPEIYFIRAIDRDPTPSFFRQPKPKGRIYYASWRQPAARADDVRAALGRRDKYPVTERAEDGKTVRYREVLFLGTTAEAIELLGFINEAAVALGARRLLHDGKESAAAVVAAVEKGLPRLTEESRGDHRRLKNLIAVLGHLGDGDERDARLVRLIDRQIDHIVGGPPEPPEGRKREHRETYSTPEEERVDVNHALAWLVEELGEEKVYALYRERLLRLRDEAKGRWKAEVQLALDVCRVEDRAEVEAGLKRLRDVKPVRSAAALRHDGPYVLAFSPDGRYLATAGYGFVRVWDTRDWSRAAEFAQEGTIERVRFSPDGKLLYVAGGAEDIEIHRRYDWRTGKLDRAYQAHQKGLCEMELSADGRRMATADCYDEVFRVTDTESGKVLESYPMKDRMHALTLSADGKTLIRAVAKAQDKVLRGRPFASEVPKWTVEAPAIAGLAGKDAWLFSPAGRYLISAEALPPDAKAQVALRMYNPSKGHLAESPPANPEVDKTQVTLRVQDASKGYAVAATRQDPRFGSWLTISADGKRLAVVNLGRDARSSDRDDWERADVRFTVLAVPSLETVSECDLTVSGEFDLRSFALSPDGKVLAAAARSRVMPYLFDATTGKRIMPTDGHLARVKSVFFPDAKTVRSLDADGGVCLWDEKMRVRQRVLLPGTLPVLSAREPDGRYLICRDTAAQGDLAVQVIDAETGKPVCSLTLPLPEAFSDPAFAWLGDCGVLYSNGKDFVRFDYRNGKVLDKGKWDGEVPHWAHRSGKVTTDDGKALAWIDGGGKSEEFKAHEADLATGKVRQLGEVRMPHFTGNASGLVPGGKYFYVSDPDMYLLDRKTMAVVASRRFRGADLLSLDFTAAGDRYAVVTGSRIYMDVVGQKLRRWDSQTPSMVRIHETFSGKTLGAFPASTRWVSVRFAPDGRLAVINEDDTIEVWDLSALRTP
jgi:WD40 repeat protein